MNAKQKGNNFERDTSRTLSLWWTGGERSDAIWRSASSGALSTITTKYKQESGDFHAVDGCAELLFKHFVIEAKRGYSRYSFLDLVDVPEASLKNNPIYQIMDTLTKQTKEQEKFGLLLWKRDRRDMLACVQGSFFVKLNKDPGILYPGNAIIFRFQDAPWFVTNWKTFSTCVSGASLRSSLDLLAFLSGEMP